jgi:hypothetical protein
MGLGSRGELLHVVLDGGHCALLPYNVMSSKGKLIQELEGAAQSMVQGSLSESSRQCGDPSCACAHDPASRHGPHLYFRYNVEGKVHSVFVPAEHSEAIKDAQSAWRRFQEVGAEISAENRAQLLSSLEREKQLARVKRPRPRRKS